MKSVIPLQYICDKTYRPQEDADLKGSNNTEYANLIVGQNTNYCWKNLSRVALALSDIVALDISGTTALCLDLFFFLVNVAANWASVKHAVQKCRD